MANQPIRCPRGQPEGTSRAFALAAMTSFAARSARSNAPFTNVLKTSWLSKPRRSRVCGRSSLRNDPVAAQFLRNRISAASSAR